MHLLAERIIVEHLIKLNIIKEAPMEELIEKRVGAVFFPHGLGHLLDTLHEIIFFKIIYKFIHCMRVHDVGGYLK